MTAQYYNQPGERMDLIPTVSYGLGVPFCMIATYVVERFGLKVGLHIGGILTGIGELYIVYSDYAVRAYRVTRLVDHYL